MTKRMPHIQISGRAWQMVVLCIVCTVFSTVLCFSSAQQPHGFISIDCGSALEYNDPSTSLTWEKDDGYISTGINAYVGYYAPFRSYGGTISNITDNYQALNTLRYFPEPQAKYCYELPISRKNISVLIRAMFFYGGGSELVPRLVLPIVFTLYINSTLWGSVQYSENNCDQDPQVIEGIIYNPGDSMINICLVPNQGVPFISSLELRELDPQGAMYSFKDSKKLLLSSIYRSYVGDSRTYTTVRYPDDAYDRLWKRRLLGNFISNHPANYISSQKEIANTSSKWNNIPPNLMMRAAFESVGTPLFDYINVSSVGPDGETSYSYISALFYSQALNKTKGVNMVVSINAEQSAPFNVSSDPVLTVLPHLLVGSTGNYFNVSSSSGFGAVLSAMEVYKELLLETSTTYAGDLRFMRFLKRTFNLRSWQGDPCLPVPYDDVTCASSRTFDGVGPGFQRITSLHLAHLTDSDKLQNTASLFDEDYYTVYYLGNLSVTYSHIDDGTAQFLFANFYTAYSNLSHNSLTSLPFHDCERASYPAILDLSHNLISGDSFSNFLFPCLLHNTTNLEEIYLSDNMLNGALPSDLFLQTENSQDLTLLNLDRNQFTGVLNLTSWDKHLQAARNDYSLLPNRLCTLLHNNITDILPDTEEFLLTIASFMRNHSKFNQSGVLLAGNPYCKNIKSTAQRFLCRSAVDEIVFDNLPKNNHIILKVLPASLVGAVLLALAIVMSIASWNYRLRLLRTGKQLEEVQQALSSKEVHPKFYSYQELRVATEDFHEDHRLGSGAFGEVFEGTLDDCKIAVKRLLNTNRKQVLKEFLSEVVLISGLRHKHLIQLKGCCIEGGERILVFEFAANGNLADVLWGDRATPTFGWHDRLRVALGVARGLLYLHEELQPCIIHRDIKALNVLLDKNHNAKIADFGLAKHLDEKESYAQCTAIAGTRGYSAPEYLMAGDLTPKADVFSFGILLLEMMAGRKCIDNSSPSALYIKQWAEDLQKSGMLAELLQPELRETVPDHEFATISKVALLCIKTEPKLRPTMFQVVTMLLEDLETQVPWIKAGRDGESHGEDVNFTIESAQESTQSGTSFGTSRNLLMSRCEEQHEESEEELEEVPLAT